MLRIATIAAALGAALGLGVSSTALAVPSGQTIGFTCFACHGDMGKGTSTIPPLAGRSADSLYETMVAFKTGARKGTVMNRHATGYSDEELRALAEYFASLPAK